MPLIRVSRLKSPAEERAASRMEREPPPARVLAVILNRAHVFQLARPLGQKCTGRSPINNLDSSPGGRIDRAGRVNRELFAARQAIDVSVFTDGPPFRPRNTVPTRPARADAGMKITRASFG